MTINSQSEFYTERNAREMLGIQHSLHRPIDLRQANDSVRTGGVKKKGALQHFQIPNKTIILVKLVMDDMVAKVQVQTEMTEL